jgi:hypothetical protein
LKTNVADLRNNILVVSTCIFLNKPFPNTLVMWKGKGKVSGHSALLYLRVQGNQIAQMDIGVKCFFVVQIFGGVKIFKDNKNVV